MQDFAKCSKPTEFDKTLHNLTRLHKTLRNFYKTLQNSTKLHNTLQDFNKLVNTLHKCTELFFKTSHNFTNSISYTTTFQYFHKT